MLYSLNYAFLGLFSILKCYIWSLTLENLSSGVQVATVREKVLENEKNSRPGKSQGISFSVREI